MSFGDCLISLGVMTLMFIHVEAYIRLSHLLNLNKIPSYVHDRISFTHSSTEGHLGCFHRLATVDNAATNGDVQTFLPSILLGTLPEIQLLGHIVIQFLIFEELPLCDP